MFSKRQGSNQELDTKSTLLEKPEVDEQVKVDIVGEEIDPSKLYYTLTENPPVPLTVAVAFQHILMSLASCLATAFIISDVICAELDSPIRNRLFSTTLFMAGISTILQTYLGVRLPVFQGPSSSFIVPLLALRADKAWACDRVTADNTTYSLMAEDNSTMAITKFSQSEKLQMLSGSLMVASLAEVIVGCTGMVGPLLRLIGPMTVAPTISLIGISLYKVTIIYARSQWAIALAGTILVLVFALYLPHITVPIPTRSRGKRGVLRLPLFQLLPILLSILIMWAVCGILTVTGVLTNDSDDIEFLARTDAKSNIFDMTPWFLAPYPGQFGIPKFHTAVFIGFLAAITASMVESVGDYFACSKSADVPPPPNHAVTRGIFMEGICSVLSGALGAGHATTSYSGNVAAINLTKTASRIVMLFAGIILVIISVVGKFAAVFAMIPNPALAGSLVVGFGMLISLGISALKYVDLSSSRNLLILGVSMMVGIMMSEWVGKYPDFVTSGNIELDSTIKVIFGTPMFLGGITACLLDNTVRGTEEERGLVAWRQSHMSSKSNAQTSNKSEKIKAKDSNDLTEADVYEWNCIPALYSCMPCLSKLPFMPPLRAKETIFKEEASGEKSSSV
ncbi:solute carrier family 23 member 1-like [Gigantopelta aegis]|uniref:solute carrier family 23 member 1-like n=1 Tax=Gigantopelta aegis TaxID=1735272 RepID=UPI001B88A57A|nr:solute carrier family 23 member 1-like [Gigantopelta aegis]